MAGVVNAALLGLFHKRQTISPQFLAQATEADERTLANLWQKDREAWREVTSAADWVESLRGNR
jgi:hypothetical protein